VKKKRKRRFSYKLGSSFILNPEQCEAVIKEHILWLENKSKLEHNDVENYPIGLWAADNRKRIAARLKLARNGYKRTPP